MDLARAVLTAVVKCTASARPFVRGVAVQSAAAQPEAKIPGRRGA